MTEYEIKEPSVYAGSRAVKYFCHLGMGKSNKDFSYFSTLDKKER